MVSPKKPAFLFLLTILIVSVVVGPLPLGHAQDTEQEEDQRATTESILSILEGARSHIQTTFARLEAHHIPIPDVARSKFDEGVLKAEEAVSLRNQGRYAQANEKALEAMQRFKDAALEAAEEAEETETEEEIEAGRAINLNAARNRAEIFINNLEDLADRAEDLGYDITDIRERLAEARTQVDYAANLVEAGNVEEGEVGRAHSIAAKAMGNLQPIVKANKARQAEKFFYKTMERLTKLEERVSNLLSRLPPAAQQAASEAMQNAKDRALEVRGLIDEGNVDDAFNGLDDLREDAEKVMGALKEERPNMAESFLETEKLEGRISRLKDRLEDLKEVEVSEVRAMLDSAENLVEQAVTQLQEENIKEAEDLIDQADQKIEEADKLLEQKEEIERALELEKRAEIGKGVFINYRITAMKAASPHWDDSVEDFRLVTGGLHWDTTPVTFKVDPYESGVDSTKTLIAVQKAFDEWENWEPWITGVTVPKIFNYEEASGLQPSLDAPDYVNTVSWQDLTGTGYGNVIAYTHYWFNPATKHILDVDIVFNSAQSWSTTGEAGKCDVQNVATHEIGHALILADLKPLKDSQLTMYAYTFPGETEKRSLGYGDVLGAKDLYMAE